MNAILSLSPAVRAALYAVSSFAIFSVADAITKVLATTHSVAQVTTMVMGLSFVLILGRAFLTGTRGDIVPRYPLIVFARAILLTVDTLLIFYAFTQLPLAEVYIVAFTNPIMVSVLAFLVLGEKMTLWKAFAILLGFAGVVIALQPGSATIGLGHVAAFTGIFLFALSILVLRVAKPDENDMAFVAAMMLMLALAGGLLMIWDGKVTSVSFSDAALVLANALCTIIGNVLLVKAFRLGTAASVAPFHYTQLIWGVVLGWFVFGDPVAWYTIAGALVIIVSGIMVVRQAQQ